MLLIGRRSVVRSNQGQDMVDDVESALVELVSDDVLEVGDDPKVIVQGDRKEDVNAFHRSRSRRRKATKFNHF